MRNSWESGLCCFLSLDLSGFRLVISRITSISTFGTIATLHLRGVSLGDEASDQVLRGDETGDQAEHSLLSFISTAFLPGGSWVRIATQQCRHNVGHVALRRDYLMVLQFARLALGHRWHRINWWDLAMMVAG